MIDRAVVVTRVALRCVVADVRKSCMCCVVWLVVNVVAFRAVVAEKLRLKADIGVSVLKVILVC